MNEGGDGRFGFRGRRRRRGSGVGRGSRDAARAGVGCRSRKRGGLGRGGLELGFDLEVADQWRCGGCSRKSASLGPTQPSVLLRIRYSPPPIPGGAWFQKPSEHLPTRLAACSALSARTRASGTRMPSRHRSQNWPSAGDKRPGPRIGMHWTSFSRHPQQVPRSGTRLTSSSDTSMPHAGGPSMAESPFCDQAGYRGRCTPRAISQVDKCCPANTDREAQSNSNAFDYETTR